MLKQPVKLVLLG